MANEYTNVEAFLTAHVIGKDSTDELTHTEFGKVIKRKFHIPDSKYEQFSKLYYRDIIKTKKTHHIIERQKTYKNANNGPLLLDIDLQFLAEHTTRQYEEKHIQELIDCVLNTLSSTFEMDDDLNFIVVVQQKPKPRVVTKPNSTSIVKDGIHLMFCVSMSTIHQQYIRKKVIEQIENLSAWSEVPIINTWDDVFDSAISTGTNGWLAPLSKKPDDAQPYNVTHAYNVNYDTDRMEWNRSILAENPSESQRDAFYAQYYKQLFIRSSHFSSYTLVSDEAAHDVQAFSELHTKPASSTTTANALSPTAHNPSGIGGDEDYQISVNMVRQIKNRQDMELLKNVFLDNLPPSKYELREAFEFAMILPDTYYGPGSYSRWIKVGFALRNTNIYLLIAWVVFSAQSPSFDFGKDVAAICDFWMKFSHQPEAGVTRLSLMYWAKHESPEAYQEVHGNTVDFQIDQTVNHLTLDQLSTRGNKSKGGCCDYDVASVVYQLKKGGFIACGIRSNAWYVFNGSFWSKDDSGTTLRNLLSTEVRGLYLMKAKKTLEKAHQIKTPEGDVDVENEEHLILKGRGNLFMGIATRLGNTHDKDNIMRECRELFYDRDFEKKLDQNRYLLCFKNGVMDFKEGRFRKGYPEDYLSKCTNTDYREIDDVRDAHIMGQIEDYFNKLFPIPELCTYVWDHLASILIGDTAKTQCLHYYTGIGQNGKSMLIKFMQMILGDYATELDVSFFVNERPVRGKATPELLCLVGARFAITAEPSEGEKLNEGPMKQLTSGTDRITYRGLFKDQESFIPQTHSVIMANHYLPVKSRDHGTWRRIRVIKFVSLFVDNPVDNDPDRPYQFKKEESFDEKFAIWAPIFMGMLVRLAVKNQGSLPICDIIAEYSNEYRKDQDFIAEFMRERLERGGPEDILRKTAVLVEFQQWYFEMYSTKITGKNNELFSAIEKEYGAYKSNRWTGVKVRRDYEKALPSDGSENIITDSETDSVTSSLQKEDN